MLGRLLVLPSAHMASLKAIMVTTLVMLVPFIPVTAVVTTNARPGLMRHEKEEESEDHYHALLLAVPLAIQNLTNYSGLISMQGKMSEGLIAHKFGNIESDKGLLLEMTHGMFALMQEISDESKQACPLNSAESAVDCVGKALCLIQSHVDTVKNKEDLEKYALYEEMYIRFHTVSWPILTSKIDVDQKNTAGYKTPSQHSCHGTYNEMSDDLIETASEESADSSAKAAAYSTSAALLGAAKTTHAVLDSHTHNSSVDKTLAALHEAWEPPCKLMECDATNYLDFFRASHSHSLSLMDVGASAHHMRVHIRTRQVLELGMQDFMGKHGKHFSTLYRDEDSDPRFRAAAKQYYARGRGSLMQFATEYPQKRNVNLNTLEYPLSLVDSEKMQAFFEARGNQRGLDVLRSKEGFEQIEDEHSDVEEEDEDNMALVEVEEEDESNEDENGGGKGGKGSRRRSVVKKVKKTVKKAKKTVNKAAKGKSLSGLKGLANKIASNAGTGVSNAYKRLSPTLRNAGNGLSKAYRAHGVGNALKDFGNGIANGAQDLGNDIAFVADAAGDALRDFGEWFLSLFDCLGEFHETFAIGYGKLFQEECVPGPSFLCPFPIKKPLGISVSFGGAIGIQFVRLMLGLGPEWKIRVSVSIVIGLMADAIDIGGLRLGVGIALGLSCSTLSGCTLWITIGNTGSALVPVSGPDAPGCVAGEQFPIGTVIFRCFYSYTVVVTIMCCAFNLITAKEDCR